MTLGDFHEYLAAAGGFIEPDGMDDLPAEDGLLYVDPKALQGYVQKLLDEGSDKTILDFFSPANPSMVEYANFTLIRGVLDILHKRRRHDLLLQVCEQLAVIKPDFLTAAGFVSFYTRALNAQGEFAESVRLLSKENGSGVTPRFPNDIYCVKNLTYALWLSGRNREATELVEAAIARGLPRDQFQHIRFKTGAAGPRAKHRRTPEPRV